jgi:hypothetical protein
MAADGSDPKEQSLPELVKQLAQDGTALLRQEVDLAKAELGQKVTKVKALLPGTVELAKKNAALAGEELGPKGKKAAIGMGAVIGGVAFGFIALGMTAATLTAALALKLPVWAAALIVTALFAVLSAAMLVAGRSQLRAASPLLPKRTLDAVKKDVETVKERVREALPPTPEQTVETVKEDVAWIKAGMPSDGMPAPPSQESGKSADLRGSAPTGQDSDQLRR